MLLGGKRVGFKREILLNYLQAHGPLPECVLDVSLPFKTKSVLIRAGKSGLIKRTLMVNPLYMAEVRYARKIIMGYEICAKRENKHDH